MKHLCTTTLGFYNSDGLSSWCEKAAFYLGRLLLSLLAKEEKLAETGGNSPWVEQERL